MLNWRKQDGWFSATPLLDVRRDTAKNCFLWSDQIKGRLNWVLTLIFKPIPSTKINQVAQDFSLVLFAKCQLCFCENQFYITPGMPEKSINPYLQTRSSSNNRRPWLLLESFESFVTMFTGSWKNVCSRCHWPLKLFICPHRSARLPRTRGQGIQDQEICRMCIDLLRSLIRFLTSRWCLQLRPQAGLRVENETGLWARA